MKGQQGALSLLPPAQQQHQHSAYQLLSNTITIQSASQLFYLMVDISKQGECQRRGSEGWGMGIVGMRGEIAWGESECRNAIRPHSPPVNGVYLTTPPQTSPLFGFTAMDQKTSQPA